MARARVALGSPIFSIVPTPVWMVLAVFDLAWLGSQHLDKFLFEQGESLVYPSADTQPHPFGVPELPVPHVGLKIGGLGGSIWQ